MATQPIRVNDCDDENFSEIRDVENGLYECDITVICEFCGSKIPPEEYFDFQNEQITCLHCVREIAAAEEE